LGLSEPHQQRKETALICPSWDLNSAQMNVLP